MSGGKRIEYDEFSLFHENAEEFGLPYDGPPVVRRTSVVVQPDPERRLSALVWGEGEPELVLLHGGAQNAHTWDTVALALGRPLVAIDLPGHGHSDGPRRPSVDLDDNADDVAIAIEALAPDARGVVGMSLGGLTSLALAGRHPALVRRLALVDVTPGVTGKKAAAIHAFIDGPESFADFDEILARTIEFNPTRSESSLRRGILHNALQREDGSWVWRYARFRFRPEDARSAGSAADGPQASDDPGTVDASPTPPAGGGDEGAPIPSQWSALWDVISGLDVPLMLVRGMREQSVVDDGDEAELRRRRPDARVAHVDAGHSVQGDAPVELAQLLAAFIP